MKDSIPWLLPQVGDDGPTPGTEAIVRGSVVAQEQAGITILATEFAASRTRHGG